MAQAGFLADLPGPLGISRPSLPLLCETDEYINRLKLGLIQLE